jgi:hypothetical protein
MKITEIVNGIHWYVATVRIKRGKTITTAKTIIYAENATQAKNLLSAMYGDNSVVSVRKVSKSELSETNLNQAVLNRTTQRQAPEPVRRVLPTEYTRKLTQKALLNQMKRNALHVKPTIDDLRAAENDFETEQKRVNLSYAKALKDRETWSAIRKRRLKINSLG